MIHISGATTGAGTAQLYVVKESEGRLRASATRRALYRAAAAKSFDILEHISNQLSIVKLQEELTKENKVVTPITLLYLLNGLGRKASSGLEKEEIAF